MKRRIYDSLVDEAQGPLAKVRMCRLCGFKILYRLGGGGRGGGFVRGNKARGAMIAHLREKHAPKVAELEGK
jgi:hypothetical protein